MEARTGWAGKGIYGMRTDQSLCESMITVLILARELFFFLELGFVHL